MRKRIEREVIERKWGSEHEKDNGTEGDYWKLQRRTNDLLSKRWMAQSGERKGA